MPTDDKRLRVVEGSAEPQPHSDPALPIEVWTCRRCERDTGTANSLAIEVLQPYTRGNRVRKGDKQLICLPCYLRGVITPVI